MSEDAPSVEKVCQYSPSGLLTRLKDVRARRSDYEDGSPTLSYCLKCDESVLAVQESPGEYRRLDCRHDHHEYILEEGWENAQVSAWIDCMEFLGVEE